MYLLKLPESSIEFDRISCDACYAFTTSTHTGLSVTQPGRPVLPWLRRAACTACISVEASPAAARSESLLALWAAWDWPRTFRLRMLSPDSGIVA